MGFADHCRRHEAARRRVPAAHARCRHPDPAEPRRLVGRTGRGGRDGPRRPLGQRRPHLARARVPEPARGEEAPRAPGLRADRAPLRVPAVPGAGVDGPGSARRGEAQVLELHPAPRIRPARGARDRSGAGTSRDRARARRRPVDRGRTDGALRGAPPRGDRGHARSPPTHFAPSWPATRRRSSSTGTSTSRTSASSAVPSAASARAGARPTPTR